MFEEWHDGDWAAAAGQFGNEGAQRFADVAMALAPCVLARFPRAAEALKAARATTYERISATVASASARLRGSQAVQVLAQITRAGYELSPALLRQLYGLTDARIAYLRGFAVRNRVLITLRTRSYDALRWGEAFFKPEQIKIKTVNWIDVEYLGYSDTIGRLVIGEPVDPARVIRQLRNEGHRRGAARYQEVMDRLATRTEEWVSTRPGMVRDLRRAAERRRLQVTFSEKENLLDPSLATVDTTEVGLRLSSTGRRGVREWVVEVDESLGGTWRSVVGDVDVIALTDLHGRALPDAVHRRLLQQLHQPAAAAQPRVGDVDEERSVLVPGQGQAARAHEPGERRAAPHAQFGGDGVARAVRIDLRTSDLRGPRIDAGNYTIFAEGGYVLPSR